MLAPTKQIVLVVPEPRSCCAGIKNTSVAIGYIELVIEIIFSFVVLVSGFLGYAYFVFISLHTFLTLFAAILVHQGVKTNRFNCLMLMICLNWFTITLSASYVSYLVISYINVDIDGISFGDGIPEEEVGILIVVTIVYSSFTSVLMTCFRHLATVVEVEKMEKQLNMMDPQAPPPYQYGYTAFP